MDWVDVLREQAQHLREIAARSSPTRGRILDLARRCEELADSLPEQISTRTANPPRPH